MATLSRIRQGAGIGSPPATACPAPAARSLWLRPSRPVAASAAANRAPAAWPAADAAAPPADALEARRVTRRGFFAVTVGGVAAVAAARGARAAPAPAAPPAMTADGFKVFEGYAVQPDLYLGQGYKLAMNYEGAPKYKFDYPASWEAVPVSKTDKSTMGMDGLVHDPASRGRTKAFVIALGGKDYEMARLTDLNNTLRAMAGGDPDLREAVSNASAVKGTVKKIDGVETYCYEITGDKAHYLAKVAVKDGCVYGLFASARIADWDANEAPLRRVYDSFKLM